MNEFDAKNLNVNQERNRYLSHLRILSTSKRGKNRLINQTDSDLEHPPLDRYNPVWMTHTRTKTWYYLNRSCQYIMKDWREFECYEFSKNVWRNVALTENRLALRSNHKFACISCSAQMSIDSPLSLRWASPYIIISDIVDFAHSNQSIAEW